MNVNCISYCVLSQLLWPRLLIMSAEFNFHDMTQSVGQQLFLKYRSGCQVEKISFTFFVFLMKYMLCFVNSAIYLKLLPLPIQISNRKPYVLFVCR